MTEFSGYLASYLTDALTRALNEFEGLATDEAVDEVAVGHYIDKMSLAPLTVPDPWPPPQVYESRGSVIVQQVVHIGGPVYVLRQHSMFRGTSPAAEITTTRSVRIFKTFAPSVDIPEASRWLEESRSLLMDLVRETNEAINAYNERLNADVRACAVRRGEAAVRAREIRDALS